MLCLVDSCSVECTMCVNAVGRAVSVIAVAACDAMEIYCRGCVEYRCVSTSRRGFLFSTFREACMSLNRLPAVPVWPVLCFTACALHADNHTHAYQFCFSQRFADSRIFGHFRGVSCEIFQGFLTRENGWFSLFWA